MADNKETAGESGEEEINLILEEPKEENVEIVQAETGTAPKVIEPEEGIETLRKSLEAEKAEKEREKTARIAAERAAAAASEETGKAKTEVAETNMSLVTNAIATVKRDADILETTYAQALTDGDYAAAAKVQRQMTENAVRLQTLEQGKAQMEQAPKTQVRVAAAVDPVEHLAGQLSPRSASWVRAHPEYARDNRLFERMRAAHSLAVTDGIQFDTDEYFEHVEKTLGLKLPGETPLSSADTGTGRLASPAAAPVSRGGAGNGSGPATVRLSAEEREAARFSGMTEKEYALQKLAIEREKGTIQ